MHLASALNSVNAIKLLSNQVLVKPPVTGSLTAPSDAEDGPWRCFYCENLTFFLLYNLDLWSTTGLDFWPRLIFIMKAKTESCFFFHFYADDTLLYFSLSPSDSSQLTILLKYFSVQ